MADYLTKKGQVPESAIDHVYHSKGIKEENYFSSLKKSCFSLVNVTTKFWNWMILKTTKKFK